MHIVKWTEIWSATLEAGRAILRRTGKALEWVVAWIGEWLAVIAAWRTRSNATSAQAEHMSEDNERRTERSTIRNVDWAELWSATLVAGRSILRATGKALAWIVAWIGEWLAFTAAWGFRILTWPFGTWALTGALAPLGRVAAWWIPSARSRIAGNLAHIRPKLSREETKALVTANGEQTLRLFIEYSRIDKMLREVAIEVEGEEHLRDRPEGLGAVIVTAHFGNWEAVRFAAKSMGCECGIIYRAFNNRPFDWLALNLITVAGRPVLQKGKGMRKLFEHVKQGGVMMILVDQRNSGAPFLNFLGRPAETAIVAAELAMRTGAALIPAVALRDTAARRFRVTFATPVTGKEPEGMMQRVNDRLCEWIDETPEQWFWLHRRWRTTSRSRIETNEA